MKTLLVLLEEAKNQKDWNTNPRTFLSIFPGGAQNGYFIDPWLGVMSIIGFDCDFYTKDFNMADIQAIWIE